MSVHNECIATRRCNVSALNISRLRLLDLDSRLPDHLDFCHLINAFCEFTEGHKVYDVSAAPHLNIC